MKYNEMSLKLHEENKGKIQICSKIEIDSKDDLSCVYTPGVAEPCRKIFNNSDDVYKYTGKGNMIAIVTDGTAVLGLGNIGPKAAIPVMEGKALLFKKFANIDAFPICLDTQNIEEIITTIKNISPVFGGINLEDIAAPKCFEIEKRLETELDIPVFHDDQHGTAIVVTAGILNSLKIVDKKIEDARIVINGAGAAGIAICKLLLEIGAKNIVMVDRHGAIFEGDGLLNDVHKEIAKVTNRNMEKGPLKEVIKNKDIFIGVSAPNIVTKEMIATMSNNSIVFAMANPTPEIMPDLAKEAGARIVATGRSDFPNQINNLLVFPGIFKGALEGKARNITMKMKLAAVHSIANIINTNDLNENNIIPSPFDSRVVYEVSKAVKGVAGE